MLNCSLQPNLRPHCCLEFLFKPFRKSRYGSITKRTRLCVCKNMAIATSTQRQPRFRRTSRRYCPSTPGGYRRLPGVYGLAVRRFHDNLKLSAIERSTRSGSDLDDAFAAVVLRQFKSAMMTKRIVTRTPKHGVGHPSAATLTNIGIIAGGAKSPQIGPCQSARKGQLRRLPPDVL